MQYSISIAIATFNGGKYLRQQLDSILSQTILPTEIVMCDDGSTDNTLSIIYEYAALYPSVFRVFENNDRLGFVKNFEKAISLCKGEIIVLSDQDDVWFPNKLQEYTNLFSLYPDCNMVYSDAELIDASGNTIDGMLYGSKIANPPTLNQFVRKINIKGCTLAFRSDLLRFLLPFPDAGWGHDHWIVIIISCFSKVYISPNPLMAYRRHGQNSGFDPANKGLRNYLSWIKLNLSLWAYEEDLRRWNLTLERLLNLSCDPSFRERLNPGSIDMIKTRRDVAEKRFLLRQMPVYRRVVPGFIMYFSGCYNKYGRGIRTLLRDLVAQG